MELGNHIGDRRIRSSMKLARSVRRELLEMLFSAVSFVGKEIIVGI
jgi:hypothetical protein